MGFLKFLGRFFGGLLIFLALTVFFTGLSFNYGLENINVLAESAEKNIPKIMQENKEVFAEAFLKEQRINKAQLKILCVQKPEELSEDFCNSLDGMTEEEAKSALVDVMILKSQEAFMPEIKELEENLKSQLNKVLKYTKYTIPIGIMIFLLGSLLIFLVEKFKWKSALFFVSIKTGMISAFVSVGNYFMKNFTPEKFENLIKALPMMEGEAPDIAMKLMSTLLTDWIKVVAEKLFLVSLTIAIVSLSIAAITFILKRKKKTKKKTKAPKEKTEKKVEKKEKVPKAKKSKKVLYSKKKK